MTSRTVSPAARADLHDISNHIALDNLAAADRVLDALSDAFALLAERPGIGHTRTDLTARRVRFWTVLGRYMVVYRERPDGIEILRVFGPGRDVAGLLEGSAGP